MDTVTNFPKICLKPKNSVFLNTQHTRSFSNHLTILQRLWPSGRKLSKNLSLLPPPQNVNALSLKRGKASNYGK